MARRAQSLPDTSAIDVALGPFDALMSHGLAKILAEDRGIRLLRDNLDHAQLEDVVRQQMPSIAIIDDVGVSTLELVVRLRVIRPDIAIIVFAHRPSRAYRLHLIAADVSCLSKSSSASEILSSIRDTAAHGHSLNTEPLTPREIDVFEHLRLGRSYPEVAEQLQISKDTVTTHAKSIRRKLGVRSKRELIGMPSFVHDRPY